MNFGKNFLKFSKKFQKRYTFSPKFLKLKSQKLLKTRRMLKKCLKKWMECTTLKIKIPEDSAAYIPAKRVGNNFIIFFSIK